MVGAVFLLLILSVASVVNISVAPVTSGSDENSEVQFEIVPDLIQGGGNHVGLNGVLFKTVIRYYCSPVPYQSNSTTILYGTNGWTFPEQDVSLTLSYPTLNQEIQENIEDYRISGYEVIMFTDGLKCSGSIAAGGLMHNHITLKFNVSGISTLSYEFWLYGAPAAQAAAWPSLLNSNAMC